MAYTNDLNYVKSQLNLLGVKSTIEDLQSNAEVCYLNWEGMNPVTKGRLVHLLYSLLHLLNIKSYYRITQRGYIITIQRKFAGKVKEVMPKPQVHEISFNSDMWDIIPTEEEQAREGSLMEISEESDQGSEEEKEKLAEERKKLRPPEEILAEKRREFAEQQKAYKEEEEKKKEGKI